MRAKGCQTKHLAEPAVASIVRVTAATAPTVASVAICGRQVGSGCSQIGALRLSRRRPRAGVRAGGEGGEARLHRAHRRSAAVPRQGEGHLCQVRHARRRGAEAGLLGTTPPTSCSARRATRVVDHGAVWRAEVEVVARHEGANGTADLPVPLATPPASPRRQRETGLTLPRWEGARLRHGTALDAPTRAHLPRASRLP